MDEEDFELDDLEDDEDDFEGDDDFEDDEDEFDLDVDLTDRVNGKPVRAYPYSIPRHNWTLGRKKRPGGDIVPYAGV